MDPGRRDKPAVTRGRPGDNDRQRQQRVPDPAGVANDTERCPCSAAPGGYLVFESVDPAGQPWLNWNRETTYVRRESPDAGVFESWLEVTGVDGDLVSIRRTYVFAADGATLT